jgi:transcription-repair coupling factor (superfamily II helicase)
MPDKHDNARSRPGGLLRASLLDTDRGEGLLKAVATVESALEVRPEANPETPTLISGLHGGAAALLLAAWHEKSGRPGLIVTPDREAADQLASDLEIWLGPGLVIHLPQQEVLAFDNNSPEPALVGDFLTGLARLRDGVPGW